MIKRGFSSLLFIERRGRSSQIIFGILILIAIVISSYFAFGALSACNPPCSTDSMCLTISGTPTCTTPKCNGRTCDQNEKCVFDPKQTAVCGDSSICSACPANEGCTISEDGSVKCGRALSFCKDKTCGAGKTCIIDLREILKCRNLALCNGIECAPNEKCIKNTLGVGSCQTATSCSAMSCPANQVCKEEFPGAGKCFNSMEVTDGGVKRKYTYESCLLERPKFLDDKGVVQNNYCYGKDKIIGTSDDCGCPLGLNCIINADNGNGECKKFCSDGTLAERCSRNQPKYCDASGNLVDRASGVTNDPEHLNDGCACPSGKHTNADNGCSGENFLEFSTPDDFGGAGASVLFPLEAYKYHVILEKRNSIVLGYPGEDYIKTGISSCKGGYYWINHPTFNFWSYDISTTMPYIYPRISSSFYNAGYNFKDNCYNQIGNSYEKITCPIDYKVLRDYESYCFIPDGETKPSFEVDLDSTKQFNSIDVYFGFPYIATYRIDYLPAGAQLLEENWKILKDEDNKALFKADDLNYFDGNYYSSDTDQYWIYRYTYPSSYTKPTDDGLGIKGFVKNGKTVSEEGVWDGNKYRYFIREIKLDNPILASKIRLVPLTWQPNAAIYRIFVYEKSANLKLNNGLLSEEIAGLTYKSGQFQAGGEFVSEPTYLNVPSRILDYSDFKWANSVERRDFTPALNGESHGDKVDAFITGLDRSYPNLISFANGPSMNCISCDWGYRYFGVDYTLNAILPNVPNDDYSAGEGKRYANVAVPNTGSPVIYFDASCVNDDKGIVHNNDGTISIGISPVGFSNGPCVAFPAYSPGSQNSPPYTENSETFKSEFLILPKDIGANRLVIEEFNNNIQRIKLKANYGDGSSEYLADYKKSADDVVRNVESVIDFDIPEDKRQFCSLGNIDKNCFNSFIVELYIKSAPDKRMRLLEIGVYKRTNSNIDNAEDSKIRFLFKSAETKEGLNSAQWRGPNGVLFNAGDPATSFSNNIGQPIGETHKGHQWFQWKAIFLSSSTHLSSPVLNKVEIGYYGGRNKPPVAAIKFDGDDIAVGRAVDFDGSPSEGGGGEITNYKWEFSDGTNDFGESISHTFPNPGVNSVSLTITNQNGLTSKFSQYFTVAPYDCFAPDTSLPDDGLFAISEEDKALLKAAVLGDFAEASGIDDKTLIDTPEEYMAAALYYTYTQITYRSDAETIQCVRNAGINPISYSYFNVDVSSLPLSKKQVDELKIHAAFTSGDCACSTPYCGDCKRFSIFYTTILRAMGINSKCIYTAVSNNHAANIVNYNGKYRLIDPQILSLNHAANSDILESYIREVSMPAPHSESTYFIRGVINDKVGDVDCTFGTPSCHLNVGDTQVIYPQSIVADEHVRNYPGTNGLPDSSKRCTNSLDRSAHPKYASSVQYYGMEGFGRSPPTAWAWDPATLFEDVCP